MDEISFYGDEHIYVLNGTIVPSVSAIIAPLIDYSAVHPAVLENKRIIGHHLHQFIHVLNLSAGDAFDISFEDFHESIFDYLPAFFEFKKDLDFKITECEKIVYSSKLKYAGRYDIKGTINNNKCLIDIKTVHTVAKVVGVQLAGYELTDHFDGEEKLTRVALQLKKNGKYRLYSYRDKLDYKKFLELLEQYHLENGTITEELKHNIDNQINLSLN
jgi:hypothetical protein